jgi:hypothetical protein
MTLPRSPGLAIAAVVVGIAVCSDMARTGGSAAMTAMRGTDRGRSDRQATDGR